MIEVSGIVTAEGDTLPSANVYISDAEGNQIDRSRGTATNVDGIFKLPVTKDEYFSVSFVGYGKKTFKVDDVCSGAVAKCRTSVKMDESGLSLPEFVVEVDGRKRPNYKKIALWSGIGLVATGLILLLVKKQKEK